MRKAILSLIPLIVLLLLSGCAKSDSLPTMPPTYTPTITKTPSATPTQAPPTSTPAPVEATLTATATETLAVPPGRGDAASVLILQYDGSNSKYSDKMMMTPAWLENQFSWLAANGYRTLTADQLAGYAEGSAAVENGSVALTFNLYLPIRKDIAENVLPLLRQYGLHAIFFLRASNQVVGDDCTQTEKFCWEELRAWADEGLVSYGSYGISYVNLDSLDITDQRWELTHSRELMEQGLGLPVFLFAYPFDNPTDEMIQYAPQAGYRAALGGYNADFPAAIAGGERYLLPRLRPYSHGVLYPQITGTGKTFEDLLAMYTGYNPSGIVITSPIYATDSVDTVKRVCASVTTDMFQRGMILQNSPFTPDLSAGALDALPGFQTIPSCNYVAGNKPEAIVLHYSEGGLSGTLSTFWTPNNSSAHYIIDRDGKVVQMVPEILGALHANCNGVRTNCVDSCPICDGQDGRISEPYLRSISIELINYGRVTHETPVTQFEDFFNSYGYRWWEEYTPAQLASLKILVYDISTRWGIPVDKDHIIGHYRINPRPDPGPALNLFWPRQGYPPADPIFP